MTGIIVATVILAVIGILIGVALVRTGERFKVEVDERETQVRELLPGNNCGACGFAGCDAMAAAIAKGEAPVNGCPVGGGPVAEKIGAVMGVVAEASERKVAFVRCAGTCDKAGRHANYVGINDCRAAMFGGVGTKDCTYGCMGYGSCVAVCPEHAISIQDGVAVVNRDRCIGCGLCTKACPKSLIELVPVSKTTAVRCMNKDRGPAVRKACSTGCIACGLCTRVCEHNAIVVENNVAHVIYENCVMCGKCIEKCPSHVIENLLAEKKAEEQSA